MQKTGTAWLDDLTQATEAIIGSPFEWCWVPGGVVRIEAASEHASARVGTAGGVYEVEGFAMAKYPITNAQYRRFIAAPNGQRDESWWNYSVEAVRWRRDHKSPQATAFEGDDVSRTRVSWFDSMAFCAWLSHELAGADAGGSPSTDADASTWCVRLPSEQEWQRAAVGDTAWRYPWGDALDEGHANFGNHRGRPIGVGSQPKGRSVYGLMDMVGNLWEWCRTRWGDAGEDVDGYVYRVVKGGAWNVSDPEHLRATDRTGFGPRARLNDGGFRCMYRPR